MSLNKHPCVWPTTTVHGARCQAYSRESIRIARTTRELLKRFVAAYHAFVDMEAFGKKKNASKMKKTFDIGGPEKKPFYVNLNGVSDISPLYMTENKWVINW